MRAGLVAWFACAAGAASAGTITPPPRWTADPAIAAAVSQRVAALPHFGGLPASVTVEAYRAPGGAALYATRVVANVAAAERDRAATAELEGTTRQRATDRRTLDGVAPRSRVVIAADTQQLVAVTGECVLADATPDVVATACAAALATLEPGVALDRREPLRIVAREPTDVVSDAPILGEGGRATLPPMAIPNEQTDRRPVYLGGALVVTALATWWNRRRRERFDREPDADADADDLHAAAASLPDDKDTKP